MSLAAEYPVPSEPIRNFDVGTSSRSSIQITYLDSEESMSNPPNPTPVHNQNVVTLNNTQSDEEKDYVNSNEISSEIASSINEDSTLTYQHSLVSDSPKKTEKAGSSSEINTEEEEHRTSFLKLLQGLEGKGSQVIITDTVSLQVSNQKNLYDNPSQEVGVSSNPGSLQVSPNLSPGDCCSEVKDFKSLKGPTKSSDDSREPYCCSSSIRLTKHKEVLVTETSIPDINESTASLDVQEGIEKPPGHDATLKAKGKKVLKEKKEAFDWDSLRREAQAREGKREKTSRTMDTVDWEAIRTSDVSEVAETIKSRGMNHKLAERIQVQKYPYICE